jgi:hypothetical protein
MTVPPRASRARHRQLCLIAVLLAVGGCKYSGYLPTEPALPTYTLQQLGLLSGGTQSQATGGSAVVIVGWATDAGGVAHAVTFAAGSATQLREPAGALSSEATAVNSAGQVVGFATLSNGIRQAVVWPSSSAAPTLLASLGGAYSFAAGINDQSTVFGAAQTDSGDTVLVAWQPNGATYAVARVDTTGGAGDQAVALNNTGQFAGNFANGGGAFFWDPTDGFDTVAAQTGTTTARGLSQYGIEVGSIGNGSSPAQAYVYTGTIGVVVMGGPPTGFTGVVANSVSAQGIIAGTAFTTSGGSMATSEAVVGTVVNPSGAFTALPTLGGTLAQAADNGITPCGVILGWATPTGSSSHHAVAWIPNGCTVP